jgi:hypothetical protein
MIITATSAMRDQDVNAHGMRSKRSLLKLPSSTRIADIPEERLASLQLLIESGTTIKSRAAP